jgi:GLPGLI family protein
MKKAFFVFTGLICFSVSPAQQKNGTIIYERKVNMYKLIQDEQMRAMMPEFTTSQHILLFSDSVSVFRRIQEDEAPDPFAGGGGGGTRMIFRGGASDGGDLYKNFTQAKSIQSLELGGRNFLIIDTIKQQPWKLSDETKQVLGYTCHKATRKIMQPVANIRRMTVTDNRSAKPDTSTSTNSAKPQGKEVEVVAWYADDILTPAGPVDYGQLPGAILLVDVDNGATVFTAKEVKKTVELKELKEPKKGKSITRAEYMKMMTEMIGGGGGMNIRVGG